MQNFRMVKQAVFTVLTECQRANLFTARLLKNLKCWFTQSLNHCLQLAVVMQIGTKQIKCIIKMMVCVVIMSKNVLRLNVIEHVYSCCFHKKRKGSCYWHFEALKIMIFWAVTSSTLVDRHQCFVRMCCFVKMQAASFHGSFAAYCTKLQGVVYLRAVDLSIRCCENLKCLCLLSTGNNS